MCWENAHIPSPYLYYLHLPRCTSRKWDNFGPKATKTERIVCGLKDCNFLGRRRKGIYVDAVLESNNNPCTRKPDSVDRGAEFKSYCSLLFVVIPYYHLSQTISYVLTKCPGCFEEAYRPCFAETSVACLLRPGLYSLLGQASRRLQSQRWSLDSTGVRKGLIKDFRFGEKKWVSSCFEGR